MQLLHDPKVAFRHAHSFPQMAFLALPCGNQTAPLPDRRSP
jgi:hypothetical protein